jgi:hypothetical protein
MIPVPYITPHTFTGMQLRAPSPDTQFQIIWCEVLLLVGNMGIDPNIRHFVDIHYFYDELYKYRDPQIGSIEAHVNACRSVSILLYDTMEIVPLGDSHRWKHSVDTLQSKLKRYIETNDPAPPCVE